MHEVQFSHVRWNNLKIIHIRIACIPAWTTPAFSEADDADIKRATTLRRVRIKVKVVLRTNRFQFKQHQHLENFAYPLKKQVMTRLKLKTIFWKNRRRKMQKIYSNSKLFHKFSSDYIHCFIPLIRQCVTSNKSRKWNGLKSRNRQMCQTMKEMRRSLLMRRGNKRFVCPGIKSTSAGLPKRSEAVINFSYLYRVCMPLVI